MKQITKISVLFLIVMMTMNLTSCNSAKTTKHNAGITLSNLDTTALPGVDFYQFACGGWQANNPLTDEYARFGSFNELDEDARENVKVLIEELAAKQNAKGSLEQKIADLYNIVLDSAKLNADGYAPIKPLLAKIATVKSNVELVRLVPELATEGTSSYFGVYVDADPKNSNAYLVQTYQGGFAMGEREYYLDNDEATTKIRDAYKKHVARMFELCGFDAAEAQKNMESVMKIETALATAAYDNVALRNPQKNYNKMSLADLQELVPQVDWKTHFTIFGITNIDSLSVGQKEHLQVAGKILATESLENQIAYLQWCVIDQNASFLSDDLFMQEFDFYGKTMSGKLQPQPRWKRAVSTVNNSLGEAIGQMYVKKHFPPEAKERMIQLVKNLQTAFSQRIDEITWMGDSTKQKAQEKLTAFHVKIGYPDKWRDYTALEIKDDSYFANMQRVNKFNLDYMISKLGKPVDKDEWWMTPQTVNAYYNPSTNEICFPAAILQPPFFDMNADDAFNYGAIGVVIGHEMTHGFDDQGRQFDKDGNMKDWWQTDDAKRFEERAQVMIDVFDKIEVAKGVFGNGKFTLGENIADYGGLKIAFLAYQNATKDAPLAVKDGYTPEQRFYIAYAGVWAMNIRPEEVLNLTKSDPHSLSKWRVNGQLPQQTNWYSAFNITESDPMFVPVDKRVDIW
ncbi:MAG: M13 family metallopeptidase [Prevotellaceae bacterium]|jgi:putative endopeptidase|nr:M13 family metallopeptidase [Prevotellaceae bacterium]